MNYQPLSESEARATYVIIPAYNEGKVIRETVRRVLTLGVHVVVVDDCSGDNTVAQVADLPITVLRHLINLGQGAAIQTGVEYALAKHARYLVTFDSDGQHDEQDIPRLIRSLVDDELDIALGSRFLGKTPGMGLGRKLLLRMAVCFTRLTIGLHLTDVHNGLRAFLAGVAPALSFTQNRMAHASEILHKIKDGKLKYGEVASSVTYSDYSKAKGQSALGLIDIVYDLAIRRLQR